MLIFEANFSTQYLILFSDSRDGHDTYKWVGSTDIDDIIIVLL